MGIAAGCYFGIEHDYYSTLNIYKAEDEKAQLHWQEVFGKMGSGNAESLLGWLVNYG